MAADTEPGFYWWMPKLLFALDHGTNLFENTQVVR